MSEVRTLTLLTRGDLLANERMGVGGGATARDFDKIVVQAWAAATWRKRLWRWL